MLRCTRNCRLTVGKLEDLVDGAREVPFLYIGVKADLESKGGVVGSQGGTGVSNWRGG